MEKKKLETTLKNKTMKPITARIKESRSASCGCGTPNKLKDACYRKAKAKYDKFPSAYASGYIAKCRKRNGNIG